MYEQYIDPQIEILDRCQIAWDSIMPNLPDDLSTYIPGLTKFDIQKSFSMIISRLKSIKVQSKEEASPFLIQTVSQNFPSWTTPLEGWIASSPANTPNIYSHLNAIWSQLNAFDNEPKIPNVEDIKRLVGEIKRLEVMAGGHVKTIADNVLEFEEKRDELLKQCNEILDKATDSLAAAARKGLAVSFEQRAAEYEEPRKGWLYAFAASLVIIFCISSYIILFQLNGAKGLERLYYFFSDIPLTLPFIWFAWFSALRFSQLGRLNEDYKFKVATALALDGYRKQAEGLSRELEEKLLDLAITNFGENPLRLLTKDSAKDAHPLAGIIDEKGWSEVLKEGLQSIASKVKS